MNKTTSFSKILATKNNTNINLVTSNSSSSTSSKTPATHSNTSNNMFKQENVYNSHKQTQNNKLIQNELAKKINQEEDSFFIDSINPESNKIISTTTPRKPNTHSIFEPNIPLEYLISNDLPVKTPLIDNDNTEMSESNLAQSQDNNFYEDNANLIDNEYEDYDLDEIDTGGELLFSDHAGLYEPINEDQNQQSFVVNENINNYDIFKLTKKNYKLTFDNAPMTPNTPSNQQNRFDFPPSNNNNNNNLKRNTYHSNNNHNNNDNSDSFASSVLLQQSSNYDENNLTSEFADYEQEEEEEEVEENREEYQEEDKVEMSDEEDEDDEERLNNNQQRLIYQNDLNNRHRHYSNNSQIDGYFMKNLRNNNDKFNESNFNNSYNNYSTMPIMLNEQQLIDENIMNWSMKLSNHTYLFNNYNNNNNKQRSKSRSPIQHSTAYYYNQDQDEIEAEQDDQNNNEYTINDYKKLLQLNPNNTQLQQLIHFKNQQQKNLSTTWGKLKHSKSSSSNIGGEQQIKNSIKKNSPLKSNKNLQQPQQNKNLKIEQNNIGPIPSVSSPSLFRLFQNSKANLNTSHTHSTTNHNNTTSSSDENNFFNKHQVQYADFNDFVNQSSSSFSDNQPDYSENRLSRSRNNNQHVQQQTPNFNNKTTSFSQIRQRSLSSCALNTIQKKQEQLEKPKQNIVNNVPGIKKSIGIQHSPNSNQQIMQTSSTIVCMLVDPKLSKSANKQQILAAARVARAQILAAAATNNNKVVCLPRSKSSLPDLTFLNDYADDKPKNIVKNVSAIVPQTHTQTINQTNGDILKRKTLKSIKRYRQTKQNTEPCAQPVANFSIFNQQVMSKQQQLQPGQNMSILDDYSQQKQKFIQQQQRQYFIEQQQQEKFKEEDEEQENMHKKSIQPNQQFTHPSLAKDKQPLKSCLKRKESNSSQQQTSSSSSSTTTSSTPGNNYITQTALNQNNASASLIIQQNKNNIKLPFKHYSSSLMFVPLVGHLFTCDHESTKRYAYYNKLEKNRRNKIYKQLIKNKNEKIIKLINQTLYADEEEDDDEEETDDDDEDEEIDAGCQEGKEEREKKCLTSKSEQDLRVKKSVTFLAHANTVKPPSSSISPSSTITTDATSTAGSTPTSLNAPDKSSPFYDHSYDTKKQQQEPPSTTISNAPLLQYNALIAMLKSNASAKAQKDHIHNIKEISKSNKLSQSSSSPKLVSKSNHVNSKKSISHKNSKKEESSNNRPKDLNYFKKYQVIDTDSISLASLSESPPSEFKFSDEEDNNEEDESARIIRNNSLLLNRQQQERISNTTTNNNNISLKKEQSSKTLEKQEHNQEREMSPTAANVSENIGSNVKAGNQINEINKNLELQQIKQNQMNQIKAAKKNFHAVLLKDAKLNNLKEILLEIKQQQQKLASKQHQQTKFETPPFSAPSSTSSSATPSTTTSSSSASSSTSSASSSAATSPNTPNPITNNRSEMKDAIERLCQHIFEFLKQGLKPFPIDSNVFTPPNSTAGVTTSPIPSSISSTSLLKSPNSSPLTLNRQQAIESNTLSLVYSQYIALWNLIEQTMNHNLAHSPLQKISKSPSIISTASIMPLQPQLNQQHIFSLPKESYVNMFQEINRYANNINQKYLIDSGINTSQLRRKHHFMVMLMSLKHKFQLFITNLLNYRQLANWLEYLNRDRSLLKKYYDIKSLSHNKNGDSGMGFDQFMSASNSSINTSVNTNEINAENLLASLSISSLSNVSIFENEEYFNYFHKLVQQFNFIDFNFKLASNTTNETPMISPTSPPPINKSKLPPPPPIPSASSSHMTSFQQVLEYKEKPLAPLRKTSRSSSIKKSNTTNLSSMTMTPSSSISSAISSIANYQNTTQTRSHSGFNLKNKIKSWFTATSGNSSNNSTNSNTTTNTVVSSASSSNIPSNNNRLSFSPNVTMESQSRNRSSTITGNNNTNSTFKSPAPTIHGVRNYLKPPSNKNHHCDKKNSNRNNTIEIGNDSNINMIMKHSMSEPTVTDLLTT